MMRKLALYEQMGIPQIWVIAPDEPIWQRFEDGKLRDSDTFHSPAHGIHFAISEITSLVR